MDIAAKRRCHVDTMNPPPVQHTIANEMWRLYTGIHEECMTVSTPPSSQKVSTNLDDELNHLIEGSKIIKYWTNHFAIPDDAVNQINWPAIEKACSNQNFIQHKWATKWAAEKLPTGSKMEDREA
eukprot:12472335-Ditylum_brightwellii.AAC.2